MRSSISLSPGETILARGQTLEPGGKGLNQAVVASRAGAHITFATAIGDDAEGALIRALLRDQGLGSAAQHVRDAPTDRSIICTDRRGENIIVSTDGLAKSITVEEVRPLLQSLASGDILLMQGNLSLETTRDSLAAAAAAGARVILNPAPIDWDYTGLLQWVHVLVLNEVEAETLSGVRASERAAEILQARGAGTVIVTLGAAGALLGTETALVVPAPAVDVVDTAGAGDVFVGVLAASLSEGTTLREACDWAVHAASLSVTRPGTSGSFPTARELHELRRSRNIARMRERL